MFSFVKSWFGRNFSDPQVIGLAFVLAIGFFLIYATGKLLLPVFASIVIAYLLEGLVSQLEKRRIPRVAAVMFVFSMFIASLIFIIVGLLPLLSRQLTQLINRIPEMFTRGQDLLLALPKRYPELISVDQISEMSSAIRQEVLTYSQEALSLSMSSVVGLITILLYFVLLPMLVFFFLKDKQQILDWMRSFLPSESLLVGQVWNDVDLQIGNYVRGKFIEILLVGVATYIAFLAFGLQFALLLSVIVALSVLIPYIGIMVVTVPVTMVAYTQWGTGPDFLWLMGVYLIVQGLDGAVLVPVLFSEVVNLHPIAIIVAVLMFGGLWGFWGVFFAIPLATVVQAVLKAWPSFHVYNDKISQPRVVTEE
jgi:putative permease